MILSSNLLASVIEVKVPVYMAGVEKDTSALKGENYVYKLEGMFSPQIITAQSEKNRTIEELINSLYYAYTTNDKKLFRTLFTREALKSIDDMSPERFEKRWTQYSSKKNTQIEFYFSYRNGFVLGLKAPDDKIFNIQFAIKSKGQWLFERFEVNGKDPRYNNISLWLTFRPLNISKASLLQTFKIKDENKFIEAQIKNHTLTFLVKGKESWEMIGQVRDNDKEFSTWPDLNSNLDLIKVRLEEGVIDPKIKNEILVLDSNFPISFYPLNLEKSGQFTP